MIGLDARPCDTTVSPTPVPFWAHLLPFVAFGFVSHLLGDDAVWARAAGIAAGAATLVWQRPWRDAATWAHVAPFAFWLTAMMSAAEPSASNYTLRTLGGAGLLAAVRPWRWYGPLHPRNLGWALAAGLLVFVVWVGPESDAFRRAAPGMAEFYERFLVGPLPSGFGRLRESLRAYPYLPARTGWTAFAIHMFGTSVVIAAIEEFFWRGFLYRWLCARDFLEFPVTRLDAPVWLAVAALFGLEHAEWFAGIVAGLVYGGLVLRTGDLWAAVVAHGTTNFLLGLHVLLTDSWWFW